MKTRWFVTSLGSLFLPFLAATALAGVESRTYEVGGETVKAYFGNFPGSRYAPGLVVIHDYWGLNEQIQGVVERLTRLGYVVMAPDLFKGQLIADPGRAQEMRRDLDEKRAVAIVKGVIDELRKLDGVKGRKVATIGFGMGGRVSLAAALRGADVQGTVMFYGAVETTREAIAPLRAPLLGIFGGRDHAVPEKDVTLFQAALKDAGKDATIVSYQDVGHCFMDETRADYEPEWAKGAWNRMRDWLAVKLEPRPAQESSEGQPTVPGSVPPTDAAPVPTPGHL